MKKLSWIALLSMCMFTFVGCGGDEDADDTTEEGDDDDADGEDGDDTDGDDDDDDEGDE